MGHVHTAQNGQRFRYYVTHPKTIRDADAPPYRIAASSIESIVVELLAVVLRSRVTSVDSQAEAERIVATLLGDNQVAKRELPLNGFAK